MLLMARIVKMIYKIIIILIMSNVSIKWTKKELRELL
jgi:hypothetical protein